MSSTARYILEMSAEIATLWDLDLISAMKGYKIGPIINMLFNDAPALLFAEASKTTQSVVVELFFFVDRMHRTLLESSYQK